MRGRSTAWVSTRSSRKCSPPVSSSSRRAICLRTPPMTARRWCSLPARAVPRTKRSSSSGSRTSGAAMHAVARGVFGLLALPAVAAAHHSFFGRFDTERLVELEGEVTEMSWRNPHAYLSVRAGGVVWEIETSSLTVLKRMGIDEGTIRVGDRIRIAANPPIGDKKEMYARHVLLPDGRELLMNVGLKPRWTQGAEAVGDDSLLMAREGDPSRPELGIFRVWSH